MLDLCKLINDYKDDPELLQASNSTASTLLHLATIDGNHCAMKHLLEMGADVDALTHNGDTPLSLALKKNCFREIQILLHAKADIYMVTGNGNSHLETVIHDKSVATSVLRLFIERVKTDFPIEEVIDALSCVNCPIYHAPLCTNTILTQSRLDVGWKVNARNPKNDETALHVAVRLCDLENVKLLLDNNANVNARDYLERTPLSYMNVKNDSDVNLEILRLLIARGAWLYKSDVNDGMQIRKILKKGVKKVVKVLLDHDIDFSRMDKTGSTAVHYLASNKNGGCINELEGKRFDPNFNDYAVITPLQRAACEGILGNIKFLLDHGANVNTANTNFRTALLYAVMADTKKRSEMLVRNECLELLLQRGADALYEGNGNHTVFSIISSLRNYSLSKPILMHLAVQELLGTPITKFILDKIYSNEYFKRHLNLYRRQLKEMRETTIFESVTLFKFIAESDEKIAKYARNQKVVKRLVRMSTKCSSTNQCKRYLKKRVTKAIHTAQVKEQAFKALGSLVNLGGGCYSDILERISDYLNDTDVKNLLDARK